MAKQKIGSKTSKRITCAKKYKIEKKVRQHKKKLKKLNLKTSKKKSKKDPGVPNSCPFKEEILREAEARKERTEAERVKRADKRKVERSKLVDKKRNLETLVKDATKRGEAFQRKAELVKDAVSKDYTGGKAVESSLKAYYREVKKVIEAADVVIEVLDARDPLGSRCPQVEQAVLESGPNKKIILLLNKIDLVPKDNVESWLKYLRNEFPTVAFKASTQTQADRLGHSKVPLTLASDDLRRSSRCLGADLLMTLLGNYCRSHDIKTAITIGIVGFPNTGKSSIINSLKRSKACNVGATPGITKTMQAVQLDKHIKLLDSPGVVMASNKTDASIVLRNSVRLEALEDPIPAVSVVLSRCNKQQLMMRYAIPDYSNVSDFLALLAKRYGKLKKHGLPDVNKAARLLLQDWNSGKITYYTQPPEAYTMSTHVSAEIVSAMGAAFDIDALLAQETDTLQGLKKVSADDVVVASEGFTAGVMDAETTPETGNEENESDWEDDDEKMEQDESTVVVKLGGKMAACSGDRNTKQPVGGAKTQVGVARGPVGVAKGPAVLAGNLQQNRARKNEFKKMKKQRRKADVLATELSTALTGSLSSLGAGLGLSSRSTAEDYDFTTDFTKS